MNEVVCIALALVLAAVLAATGWWRILLAPFRIRAERMTVDRLGLVVPSEHTERVNGILRHFSGGFNAAISVPSASAWEAYCDSCPTLYRPFAQEGAAMGYPLRRLWRASPPDFEAWVVARYPGFRYLHYVGLGFWAGMRKQDPARVARVAAQLDPLHGHLCYDGYGFKHAFFDYLKEPSRLERLRGFDGYARSVAFQGVGRAFFFLFMGDPDLLIEHVDKLGEHAVDAAGGVGLATAFIFPDRLEIAQGVAKRMPDAWHDSVHLGMCFGLKARSINDPEQFARDRARLAPAVRKAVYASIRECDRVEAEVRAEGGEDGYRRWRERVTQWMTDHIEYPLSGVISLDVGAGLSPVEAP